MTSRSIQHPDTWGTLTEEELKWAMQFGQSLSWDEYQAKRHRYLEQKNKRCWCGSYNCKW